MPKLSLSLNFLISISISFFPQFMLHAWSILHLDIMSSLHHLISYPVQIFSAGLVLKTPKSVLFLGANDQVWHKFQQDGNKWTSSFTALQLDIPRITSRIANTKTIPTETFEGQACSQIRSVVAGLCHLPARNRVLYSVPAHAAITHSTLFVS